MKKTIGNVVISCETSRECEVTKRILDSKELEYEQFDDDFEVYESKTPQEWQQLLEEIEQESRTGEFMFESECHYYCEKEIISAMKEAEKRGALGEYYNHTYCIYKETKVKTVTETRQEGNEKITVTKELPTEAMLVEVITVDENGINIR